jgi:hypothetical protein
MSVATDFRKWLLTQTTVTALVDDRVCQLNVQQPKGLPYVVFRRSGGKPGEIDFDGGQGPEETTFAVEIHGAKEHNVEAIYAVLAPLVNGFPQVALTGDSRKWNSRVIQYAAVNDVADDYEYMPVASDEVQRQVALIVEVVSDA